MADLLYRFAAIAHSRAPIASRLPSHVKGPTGKNLRGRIECCRCKRRIDLVLGNFRLTGHSREEHMRFLETRLRNVEAQMSQRPSPGTLPTHAPNNGLDKTSPGDTGSESAPTPLYEGESSFASQSAQAKEIVARFAHPDRGPDASNLSATLDSINSLLGSNLQNKPVLNETNTHSKATLLPLPAEMIVTMLRRFQGMVLYNMPILPIPHRTRQRTDICSTKTSILDFLSD